MLPSLLPSLIPNLIAGKELESSGNQSFDKYSPHSGKVIAQVTRSNAQDVQAAISAAKQAQGAWGDMPGVQRGAVLFRICNLLEQEQNKIAEIVALETGKSLKDALGETAGAIALGRFYAGEGARLYGRTTTSAANDKYAMTVRQPCGVAGLIIAANTPIANVAWKVFPALICGNACVLKAAEDTPATAWIFGKLAQQAGLGAGLLNIVQGFGREAGAAIVESPEVDVLSFTGSTAVGRWIAETAGKRLAKVSLELGGKNPLVICDDADLNNAVKWVCLSAFSNAGQRCAAASRIIVFESVYQQFKQLLLEATSKLKVGNSDTDDFGPVINTRQLDNILGSIKLAKDQGATVLCGGFRLSTAEHANGFYLAPTLLENVAPQAEISNQELFGPVAVLYLVKNFDQALEMANASPYGLTACIHTKNFDRAYHFAQKVQAGVAVVNAGTYGSEPHMPFGGVKASGNGSREPGTEALDIYSQLKDIYLNVDKSRL